MVGLAKMSWKKLPGKTTGGYFDTPLWSSEG